MRLLFVEPDPAGHHFLPYFLFFARAALASGHEVRLLTTAVAQRHPAFEVLQEALSDQVQVSVMPEVAQHGEHMFGLIRRQFSYWSSVAEGFAKIEQESAPDHVFVLSMDGLDRAMVLLGSPFAQTPFSGLFVHLKFHWGALGVAPHRRLSFLQKYLFSRVLRMDDLFAVATIDASLPDWWRERRCAGAQKLRYVPDPGEVRLIDSRVDARTMLGIGQGDRIVLVYGNISAAKNIPALLCAVQSLDGRVTVVIAGKIDEAGRRASLSSPEAEALRSSGRLHVFDQFIDMDLEQRLFAAADVIWLGYAKSFMGQSAVLAQAASAGRPVLAREGGWIGELTQRHGLGLCVDPSSAEDVAVALDRLCTDAALVVEIQEAAALFSAARSESAFASAIMACIPDASLLENR